MKNKKFFCYEIYKNVSVWSLNGSIKYNPCSLFDGFTHSDTKFDVSAAWNSQPLKQLKIKIENNQAVPGCQPCYDAEQAGLKSRRQGAADTWEQFHQDSNIEIDAPQSLDYSVGNLCNLKCMICGPHNSTAWLPDYEKLHPNQDLTRFKFEKFNQIEVTDKDFLKNIVAVHFHGGGEPLLSQSHVNLLEAIDQVRGLSDVRIFYNTNGTTKVPDSVLSLWEKCRLVEVYFSIDDVGKRFEYQRTGASWQQVCENINWFKQHSPHNWMYNINCTWGYLNLYYLDELVDWYNANHTSNRYGDPTNLIFQPAIGKFGIKHINSNTKNILLQKFYQYPELTGLVESLTVTQDCAHEDFWNVVNDIDKIRNNSFAALCPEWSKLL